MNDEEEADYARKLVEGFFGVIIDVGDSTIVSHDEKRGTASHSVVNIQVLAESMAHILAQLAYQSPDLPTKDEKRSLGEKFARMYSDQLSLVGAAIEAARAEMLPETAKKPH